MGNDWRGGGSERAEQSETAGRPEERSRVLTINAGSSSLKFAVFTRSDPPMRRLSGKIERIGGPDARMSAHGPVLDALLNDEPVAARNPAEAASLLIGWLGRHVGLSAVAAIGHRVVHGGAKYTGPGLATPKMLEDLRSLSGLDPDHLPAEIALIEEFGRLAPGVPQVACFDTAFHHDMPRLAQILPIPRRYEASGVRRYGFHGLSYEYLLGELERLGSPGESQGRVILAHLGSGASLAAVLGGKSQDTTMAFTPTAGLVMGTRTGDLDPGLVAYLARVDGMSPERFDHMVNAESGLLGVSQTSADVRDLLAREAMDVRAAEAIDLFCYSVAKWIGAFTVVHGGLDTLVFSGGIGENAVEVRARVCARLGFLGVDVEPHRNDASSPLISRDGALVKVRVIPTDEEMAIARSVVKIVSASR